MAGAGRCPQEMTGYFSGRSTTDNKPDCSRRYNLRRYFPGLIVPAAVLARIHFQNQQRNIVLKAGSAAPCTDVLVQLADEIAGRQMAGFINKPS